MCTILCKVVCEVYILCMYLKYVIALKFHTELGKLS